MAEARGNLVDIHPTPPQPIKDEIDEIISEMTLQNAEDEKPIKLEPAEVDQKPPRMAQFQRYAVSRYGALLKIKRRYIKKGASIAEQFKIPSWRCDLCSKQYSSKQNLVLHRCFRNKSDSSSKTEPNQIFRRHLIKRKLHFYNCEQCSNRYLSKQGLLVHYCLRQFTVAGVRQKNDLRTKWGRKRGAVRKPKLHLWRCDSCGNRYTVKHGLVNHRCLRQFAGNGRATHKPPTNVRTWRCDLCSSWYTTKYGLLAHRCIRRRLADGTWTKRTRATKIKDMDEAAPSFTCDSCAATLKTKQTLLMHRCVSTRRQQRPLEFDRNCDDCGIEYQKRASLLLHISQVHLGIRPYWCGDCGITFTQEISYNNHRSNKHNEGKNTQVACDQCGQTFTQQFSLREHIFKRHVLERSTHKMPFRCGICRIGLLYEFRLRQHMLIAHARIRSKVHCAVCHAALSSKAGIVSHFDSRPNHRNSI